MCCTNELTEGFVAISLFCSVNSELLGPVKAGYVYSDAERHGG